MNKEELEKEIHSLNDLSKFGGLDAEGQSRLTDITIELIRIRDERQSYY